jgi:hypothetical protein
VNHLPAAAAAAVSGGTRRALIIQRVSRRSMYAGVQRCSRSPAPLEPWLAGLRMPTQSHSSSQISNKREQSHLWVDHTRRMASGVPMPAARGSPAGPNQWFCGAPAEAEEVRAAGSAASKRWGLANLACVAGASAGWWSGRQAGTAAANRGRCSACNIPVVRARMPAYVVPLTVLPRMWCTKRMSFDTTAAAKGE